MKGYITLKIVLKLKNNAKMINVKYLVVDAHSLYNIITRLHAFDLLRVALSTLYLRMKYQLCNRPISVINGYQETA